MPNNSHRERVVGAIALLFTNDICNNLYYCHGGKSDSSLAGCRARIKSWSWLTPVERELLSQNATRGDERGQAVTSLLT